MQDFRKIVYYYYYYYMILILGRDLPLCDFFPQSPLRFELWLLVVRYVEIDGRGRRATSVIKLRSS